MRHKARLERLESRAPAREDQSRDARRRAFEADARRFDALAESLLRTGNLRHNPRESVAVNWLAAILRGDEAMAIELEARIPKATGTLAAMRPILDGAYRDRADAVLEAQGLAREP